MQKFYGYLLNRFQQQWIGYLSSLPCAWCYVRHSSGDKSTLASLFVHLHGHHLPHKPELLLRNPQPSCGYAAQEAMRTKRGMSCPVVTRLGRAGRLLKAPRLAQESPSPFRGTQSFWHPFLDHLQQRPWAPPLCASSCRCSSPLPSLWTVICGLVCFLSAPSCPPRKTPRVDRLSLTANHLNVATTFHGGTPSLSWGGIELRRVSAHNTLPACDALCSL